MLSAYFTRRVVFIQCAVMLVLVFSAFHRIQFRVFHSVDFGKRGTEFYGTPKIQERTTPGTPVPRFSVLRSSRLHFWPCRVFYSRVFSRPKIPNGEINGKVSRNSYPGPDQHQKLIIFRWSPPAHAYHVWSTSSTAIVSYPAHRTT